MSVQPEPAQQVHTRDFFEWSQDQAKILKSLRLLCRDVPPGLDLDNIAEEIEDLGRAELKAVESYACNILVHLLKAVSEPNAPSLAHWRTEATTFYAGLVRTYSASMRQRVDMQTAWRLAIRIARASLQEFGSELTGELPADCPFSIDDLVSGDFDFDRACDRLASRSAGPSRS